MMGLSPVMMWFWPGRDGVGFDHGLRPVMMGFASDCDGAWTQSRQGSGPILTGLDKSIQICSTTSTANDILNMAILAACKVGE